MSYFYVFMTCCLMCRRICVSLQEIETVTENNKQEMMKNKFWAMAGFVFALVGLSSCGSFLSLGGGVSSYDGAYPYGGYNDYAANAYQQVQQEALFLADKMAYELQMNAAQYEAAYEINLDYLLSLRSGTDLYGNYWARRNADLRYVLTP